MASTLAAAAARRVASLSRASSPMLSLQSTHLTQRRGLAGGAVLRSGHSGDVADLFESSLNLEETHFNEGYAEEHGHCLAAGREEARQVGLKLGLETGEELWFYRGCVDVWSSVIRVEPTRSSSQVQQSVKSMELLLERYPITDPKNESIREIMVDLRLKLQAICGRLGVQL